MDWAVRFRVRAWHAHCAEDGGEVSFFSGGVDETAACEGGGVQGAETARGDD